MRVLLFLLQCPHIFYVLFFMHFLSDRISLFDKSDIKNFTLKIKIDKKF